MLESQDIVTGMLCCPRTGAHLVKRESGCLASEATPSIEYQIIQGIPVVIDFENSILRSDSFLATQLQSNIPRESYSGIKKIFHSLVSGSKAVTRKNVQVLKQKLSTDARNRVLIVGGGTIGQSMQPLYDDPNIRITSFDIYASAHTHFVADAHSIPLPSAYFDCVIIQAVLEHVLMPQQVVREIHRVLKSDGIVYAETPFLQHVHEGPYDFTRFTESGHRFLFKDFMLVDSGATAGPGTQMLWTIDYFYRSIFRSRTVGKIFKLLCFWVQYLDYIVPEPYKVDAASGVFFLGTKSNESMPIKSIVTHYNGAQK